MFESHGIVMYSLRQVLNRWMPGRTFWVAARLPSIASANRNMHIEQHDLVFQKSPAL